MSKYLVYIPFILTLLACGKKQLEADALTKWMLDPTNGLLKEKKLGDLEINMLYESPDYLMLGEDASLPENKWVSKKNAYASMEHFNFRLSHTSGRNVLEYGQTYYNNAETRASYYSFSAKNDFKIVVEKDTIPCAMAHYGRTYNLSPVVELSLAFPKVDKQKDILLIYEDAQYNLGRIKFLFKSEDLLAAPALKRPIA